MHENRETSEAPEVNTHDRPVGEGNSRTAHVHASEESDSGAVPMNHSNKGGKPLAEGEEGRPLIKENTHQSSTHSTQSEARVSQGLAGVRKAARERKGMQFTAFRGLAHDAPGLARPRERCLALGADIDFVPQTDTCRQRPLPSR